MRRVTACVRVERRRGAVADDARRLLVLEDDHEDVVERRDRGDGGRSGNCERRASEREAERRSHVCSARRRTRWRPAIPSTKRMRERNSAVHAVVRDRVGGRLAGVERDEADERRPDDAAERVPEEEPPPGHARDSRHPRTGDANAAEEAREEDGLAAVPLEEPFRGRQDPVGDALQPGVAVDQLPAELASEPVADVVPDDRGRRGDARSRP